MRTALISAALLLCALPAFGLEPYLVKDINPVPEPADGHPAAFVNLGPVALFAADDGLSGEELWRSDGTAAGTWQVADLCPGECQGGPRPYAVTDRLYFFIARGDEEPGSGRNLWVTDGTPAGTFRLTDSSVKLVGRAAWMADQGVLYFPARDAAHEPRLWRTDGTPAGTHLVADLVPSSDSSVFAASLTPFKGSLYFTATDKVHGGALWKTDGTPAGTVLVKDPVPSKSSNGIGGTIGVVGNRLLFLAQSSPEHVLDLWASDGTAKGTAALTAPGTLLIYDYTLQGGRLYFVADDGRKGQELWTSDGTVKGTRQLTHMPLEKAFFASEDAITLNLSSISPLPGNRFFFRARDGAHGVEAWVTDGTVKGTRLLRDLCPGVCNGAIYLWRSALPGRVFLAGTNGTRGTELWVTDGTETGTHLVRDICRAICSSNPFDLSMVKGRIVFLATDGADDSNYELWTTDGTAANTLRLSDFPVNFYGNPVEGLVIGDQFLLGAPGPEGNELWRTDGTAAGTRLVRDIDQADVGGSNPREMMRLGGEAFFVASNGLPGFSLWKSDGTAAGTLEVRAFSPDEVEGEPIGSFAEAGNQLFFLLRKNVFAELWRTDGTGPGTYRVTGEDVQYSGPEVEAVGGKVFFAAEDLNLDNALWVSDGTAAGTRRVGGITPGSPGPKELTAFGGKLYASDESPDLGRELWRSDGTEAGTVMVKDIQPGDGDSDPSLLTVHAGRLWFFANDGVHGRELWSSDGTAAGTALAADLEPGPGFFDPSLMVSLGDRLLIAGSLPGDDEGVWVSDGTPAGTRKISGAFVSVSPYYPKWAVFQDRLYFAATDRVPLSVWVTDGTEAGTGPLLDRDGHEILYPNRFAVAGDRLVFTTEESGVPLWESDGTPAGTFRLIPATDPHSTVLGGLIQAGSRVFFPNYSREAGVELWAVEP
jgi:ELWxxDGT repeat protein